MAHVCVSVHVCECYNVCALFVGCFVPFDDCMLMFSFIAFVDQLDSMSQLTPLVYTSPFSLVNIFHIIYGK